MDIEAHHVYNNIVCIYLCIFIVVPEKLHNGERNDLYSSPDIIRVLKSKRMRRAGHVARMEERRGTCRVLVGKPEGN